MTEKLYYKDQYLKECEAQVIDVIDNDKEVLVVLDKTIFYPEGGGQPSDVGEIDGIKVHHVFEKGDVIYHHMNEAPKNKKVVCKIDFDVRFDHMQQHAGEHLLSGAILKLFGGNNKGFHMGDEYVTLDVDIDHMTDDMVKTVEDEVNSYIYKDREFHTCIVSREKAEKFPIRKKLKDGESSIRIVEVKDMDCCPCCGTHVARTGEIGLIKITKTERYKGMTRIYLKCGNRALKDVQVKQDIISNLSKYLSTDEYGLIDRVQKQSNEIDELKKQVNKLNKIFADQEAEKIINRSYSKVILQNYEYMTFDQVQLIGSSLSKNDCIFILSSVCDKKIIFENNTDLDIKCGRLFKEHIRDFNGKGGGKDKRAQGTFDSEEDLIKFCDFLYSKVNESID
ncbi:alanine--tRNA ligase-related protein [Clostridium sp. JN-1]|uniref:alanyl-tRNA editing protein n=1 Tax=Clostridium sp. JN-1 TaxID=2483110 RepID=UPI000F0B584F|nr:alanine--tRNA ligase-related protein [Clostridium sp. JN-1]